MSDADISGWTSNWLPAREQFGLQGSSLNLLRGHRIVSSWLAWDLDRDEWFADFPVVLAIDDGRQLEVSWKKFDDLSITWNTIDVTAKPTGYWTTWPLVWRPQAHDALRAVTGRSILSASSTEHCFTTRTVWPVAEEEDSVWLVGGLWLQVEGKALHVFNALDENGLENNLDDAGTTRVRPLAT